MGLLNKLKEIKATEMEVYNNDTEQYETIQAVFLYEDEFRWLIQEVEHLQKQTQELQGELTVIESINRKYN